MSELPQLQLRPVNKNRPALSAHQARQILTKLPGWEITESDNHLRLEKVFNFESYQHGLAFANLVAQAADSEDHHPAILIEWGKVTVTWWTHTIGGLHQNDFIMAAKTEQLYSAQSAAHP